VGGRRLLGPGAVGRSLTRGRGGRGRGRTCNPQLRKPGGLTSFGLAKRVGVCINMDAPSNSMTALESLRQVGASYFHRG